MEVQVIGGWRWSALYSPIAATWAAHVVTSLKTSQALTKREAAIAAIAAAARLSKDADISAADLATLASAAHKAAP